MSKDSPSEDYSYLEDLLPWGYDVNWIMGLTGAVASLVAVAEHVAELLETGASFVSSYEDYADEGVVADGDTPLKQRHLLAY